MKRFEFIAELVNERKWKFGVEIGVWMGSTFFHLLDNCPDLKKLVGIDQWKAVKGYGNKETTGYCEYDKKGLNLGVVKLDVINKAADYENGYIMESDSTTACELFVNETFDFVFIDGDHRSSFVRSDIAVWTPKIKKGGMLLGHDWHIPAVQRAISDIPNLIQHIDCDHVWSLDI